MKAKTVTSITRAQCDLIMKAVAEAANEHLKGLGLTAEAEKATFNDVSCAIKIRVTVGGDVESARRTAFLRHAEAMGFAQADYGREFVSPQSGRRFRLVGLDPKKTKYQVKAAAVDSGVLYKFPLGTVRMMLHVQEVSRGA